MKHLLGCAATHCNRTGRRSIPDGGYFPGTEALLPCFGLRISRETLLTKISLRVKMKIRNPVTKKGCCNMRILMIDIDTLRPDHMGCYGYGRDTTPCMDRIAAEGIRFDNYYTCNAPCLPSRAALATGMYGIHTGVVGHGGTAADMRLEGIYRGFQDTWAQNNLFHIFRRAGMHTVSVSSFAERHSAFWFYAGFHEMYNVGKCGMESAEEVTPLAYNWLQSHAAEDNWFLHFHLWDPHTPYRAPAAFGNPYADCPLPDDWISEEIFQNHLQHVGPHSAQEINMWNDKENPAYPRHPGRINTLSDMKTFIDNYDCAVRYADDNVSQLISVLKKQGVYEDTAIIITSDHGENLGELGLYAEHGTADYPCCRIPMIIRWPGMQSGAADMGLHENIDLAPTVADLLGIPHAPNWDGSSYAETLRKGADCGKPYVVLNQCAHVCQRSILQGDYLYIRTAHGGYHLFSGEMLYDIRHDPHETCNLIDLHPEIADRLARQLQSWEYDMMTKSDSDADPMWTVLREGGPLHARGNLYSYADRLRRTGRAKGAEELLQTYRGLADDRFEKSTD